MGSKQGVKRASRAERLRFESHRARPKSIGFLLQFRNSVEAFYIAKSQDSHFESDSPISEFVQTLNGPLRLLSVFLLGFDCYGVGIPPTYLPTRCERTRVGSLRSPEVRCGTSPGRSVSPSEEEGTRPVGERATFRSDARRSGPGANRPRPRDRPEAAPCHGGPTRKSERTPSTGGRGRVFAVRRRSR